MKERHAIAMVLAGDIQGAVEACSNIWASFPGNSYGQGGHSMEALLGKFDAWVPDSEPAQAV
jgi:muramidase (phage lysozyme)